MVSANRRVLAVVLCATFEGCAGSSPTAPESQAASHKPGAALDSPQATVTVVTLVCPTVTFPSGTTTQLSVTATFADGSTQDVTAKSRWISNNRLTATVSEEGVVTTIQPGLTTIKATYKAITGACEFHVDDTPPAPPTSGEHGIVINEFRSRGPRGGDDEFIELRNDATVAIDISAWRVKAERSPPYPTVATIPAGVKLNPGCHFLLTRSVRTGAYSGPVPGDQTFTANLNDDGGIVILRADDTVVDAVGMSHEAWYEGLPLAGFGKANGDRSFRRVGSDTNNNFFDFVMGSPSTPANRAGECSVKAPEDDLLKFSVMRDKSRPETNSHQAMLPILLATALHE